MRQLLSTALVACIVGALAGASFGAVAQAPAEPPVTTTALNADTVDGLSAVKATNKKAKRRNRLVATDAKGFLPSNIIKAKWGLIAGKPAFLADGLVGWNEIAGIPGPLADGQVGWGEVQGIPGALADGQVGWNEVQGIPAGFADGVDNVGTTGYLTQTVACHNPIAAGGEYFYLLNLPRNMVHQFQLVSTTDPFVGEYLYIERVEWYQNPDGTQNAWILIDDLIDSGVGTCNVRRISFTNGISVAKAKKQLKKVEVGYAKKHRR